MCTTQSKYYITERDLTFWVDFNYFRFGMKRKNKQNKVKRFALRRGDQLRRCWNPPSQANYSVMIHYSDCSTNYYLRCAQHIAFP